MRFLGLLKATKHSEAGTPPSPELMERMGKFLDAIKNAGVLVVSEGLTPSANGVRVRVSGDQRTLIDGPFTESKELVASYAILEAKSMDEAVEWTTKFLKVLGEGECEIRPIFDPTSFPSGETEVPR